MKQKSMRSERKGAKLDGGHTTPMSGAGRKKGDYHANGYLVEDKITEIYDGKPAVSFRVTADMIQKTVRQALAAGLLPMWRITIPGCPVLRILREDDYLYLEAMAAKNADQD